MLELSETLHIPLPYAVGIMESLWHFAADFAPAGDIGKFSDKYIAAAIGWPKPPGVLIAALLKSGWLDEDSDKRFAIHDWKEHADRGVCEKLKNAGKSFHGDSGNSGAPQGTDLVPTTGRGRGRDNGLDTNPEIKPVSRARSSAIDSMIAKDWPRAAWALREKFPDVDDQFVRRLVDSSVDAFLDVPTRDVEDLQDEILADAIRCCTKPKQTSAGLYLDTVPQCIRTWAHDPDKVAHG